MSGRSICVARSQILARAIGLIPPHNILPEKPQRASLGHKEVVGGSAPGHAKILIHFLHECAHAHLGHSYGRRSAPRHVMEMEAEKWAHEKMRENGVPVPRSMTKRAKEYVARKIDQAERRGAKKIDARARAFAGKT